MSNTRIKKLRRLYHIAKEHGLTVLGKSYFHERPEEGKSWKNGRTYYYDFTSKLDWRGERIDGLPALKELEHGQLYIFPINALQYGLGAIDAGDRLAVSYVEDWLEGELKKNRGRIAVRFDGIRQEEIVSTGSAMAIGHALSFIVRANSVRLEPYFNDLLRDITVNVEQGGCAIHLNTGIALLEVCYRKPIVVLNGWIFALFGLMDYCAKFKDPRIERVIESSLAALEGMMPEFVMANGWTYYDNNSRIASPNYHQTHVVLFGILAKMYAERKTFQEIYGRMNDADNVLNRCRFTAVKIKQKFREVASL